MQRRQSEYYYVKCPIELEISRGYTFSDFRFTFRSRPIYIQILLPIQRQCALWSTRFVLGALQIFASNIIAAPSCKGLTAR